MDKRKNNMKKSNQKKQRSNKRDSEFSSEFMNGLRTESNAKQQQK